MIINKLQLTNVFILLFSINCFSQLLIGKKDAGESVLMDFLENTTNGIVLSHVENVDNMQNVAPGTIVFDKISKKVKYFDGEIWQSISQNEGKTANEVDAEEIAINQGVIIGSETSDFNGVLIFESNDKAMVLPKVENPSKNIPSPYPGMMCLDTISNNVYFFNGIEWDMWGH